MTLKGPEFKKALLLGLVAAAVPLFYFPNAFGWSGAAGGTPRLFIYELIYYGLVFYAFFSREQVSRLLVAAITALGFRISLGVVFAVLAGGVFGLSVGQALAQGLYAYLPVALLHVALVPFLLKPVFRFRELRRPVRPERPAEMAPRPMPTETPTADLATRPTGTDQMPDFGAAVAHVASYSTVELALLVDEEGLSVARASRGGADSDLWAPVVNLVYEAICGEMVRTGDAGVRRFELTLTDHRLVVERVAPFYLAVLFDHATDELVNVRIAQAVDMVRKYAEYKYPKVAPSAATEVAYV
jgi:hypothetical protein